MIIDLVLEWLMENYSDCSSVRRANLIGVDGYEVIIFVNGNGERYIMLFVNNVVEVWDVKQPDNSCLVGLNIEDPDFFVKLGSVLR